MRGWWEGPLPDFGQVAWTNERLAGPGGRGGLQTAETDEVSGVGLVVAGSCVVSVRLRSARVSCAELGLGKYATHTLQTFLVPLYLTLGRRIHLGYAQENTFI